MAEHSILSSLYKRFFLQPLGLNYENSIVLWLLIIFGAITAGSLWYFQGNISVVLAILYITGIFLLSFLRIDYSFYVLMSAVLIFDQFGISGFNSATHYIGFFKELKEISYIPFFEAGMINAVEIQLGFIILSVLLLLAIKKDFTWRPIPVFVPFIIFFLFFAGAFINGLRDGVNFWTALWDVRAICYFFIFYLIVPQIIRTKEQVYILGWIFIVAISFKVFQGISRFIEFGFTTGELQTMTNVEDPVLLVTLFLLLLGLLVFKVKNQQRFWLLILLPLLILGFYLGFQWAALISLIISLATFILLLPASRIWKFIKYGMPVLALMVVYTIPFGNTKGMLGQPIQKVKSGFEKLSAEVRHQDYYSILYYGLEDLTIVEAVASPSIMGLGPVSVESLPVSGQYIPQTGIFWVFLRIGALGFFFFWFFFNAFIAKAINVLQAMYDPYLKVMLMVLIVAIINQMVVSYFDLQLTYYRNMIYLGCLMGMLSAIERYAGNGDTNISKTRSMRKIG